MTTMRLSPMAPAPEPGGRRRWTLGVSVLLHALVLAALVVTIRRPDIVQPYAPSYELLFQGEGSNQPPTSVDRGDDGVPRTPPAPDTAKTPPVDAPPPAPKAQPDALQGVAAPTPTAPPAPEAPRQPRPQPAPAQPVARPPQPQPPQPQPPEVRLEQPAPPAPPLPTVQAPALPIPPPPIPPPPIPPPPTRLPTPRIVPMVPPPPATTGTFAHPMDLNFNSAPSRLPAPRTVARPGSAASRSVDLSLGAPKAGPNRNEAFFDMHAASVGADWAQGLKAYWLHHRFYPPQAADNGEDGAVDIELTVNRLGRVESVVVKSRSGSAWLDMAAVATWRNAQLAPLPLETLGDTIKVPLTINYILLR